MATELFHSYISHFSGDNITIIEDPLMEGVSGADSFDAEGYP